MRTGMICLLSAALATGLVMSSASVAHGAGLHASVDWLNWKARRSGMDFVIVDPNTDTDPQGDQMNLNYDRGNGARIVLGYGLSSCWDASIEYQTFNTSDQYSIAAPAGGSLWGTRLHPDSIIGSRSATSADARATLDYDVIDLMLARRFTMDTCRRLDFTLFGGFRYAMIDQTLDINYADSVNGCTADISSPMKLDGYGIRAGGQLDCKVRGGFSVFGKGAVSVLAARVDSNYSELDDNGTTANYVVNISDTSYQAVPVIETALGVAYERGPWAVSAGYEMAFWGNVGSRRDFCDDVDDQKFSNASNDLILDGFFLRFAFSR